MISRIISYLPYRPGRGWRDLQKKDSTAVLFNPSFFLASVFEILLEVMAN